MPPRTRATKTTKGLKENIGVVQNTKQKTINKATKPARKALADKTNSASDDNASIEEPKQVSKKPSITVKTTQVDVESCNKNRPRRDRRLPNKFVENQVLNNLFNSKENVAITSVPQADKTHTPAKSNSNKESPFKTPIKDDLISNRPRRICRLPSRFEDHSVSPDKFIPVQPVHASTPIVQKNAQTSKINTKDKSLTEKTHFEVTVSKKSPIKCAVKAHIVQKNVQTSKINSKDKSLTEKTHSNVIVSKQSPTRNVIKNSSNTTSADTNNNAKRVRTLRNKKEAKTSPIKLLSPKQKKINPLKKPFNNSLSFRILDDKKKSSEKVENCDVYEFTYDPNEEPPPQKKKRKRVVKKKPVKPKTVVFTNNYDKNVAKALTALKNVVSKKQIQPPIKNAEKTTNIQTNSTVNPSRPVAVPQNGTVNPLSTIADEIVKSTNEIDKTTNNYNSVHVEDIAADFEQSLDHHEIDYSPVNSPRCIKTPMLPPNQTTEEPVNINDPLNLQEHLSFENPVPVASSSMNTSVRDPLASPWRVEFENLPIRWHINTYVKPNMTPAIECSFVNFDDNKKKHVYTNMHQPTESNNSLPQIVENTTPNLKQTSIISFIREVVEKSENKKRRALTPKKTNINTVSETVAKHSENLNKTPSKLTPVVAPDNTDPENISDANENISNKENSRESLKRKNTSDPNVVPAKTPRKDKDMFFGFDDSENQDQENVSPMKMNTHKKTMDIRRRDLRSQARSVLKEFNEQGRPTRAIAPITAKSIVNSEVNNIYEKMKSATDAPVFPEKNAIEVETTNVNTISALENVCNEDSQSVHLFEDLELIHHLKPQRKSYGRAKKMTFQQHSSDSDTQDAENTNADQAQSEEDDLDDLTFEMPNVKEKKASKKKSTKKQKLTKKEEREVEAWAAGFNSMCEDIDEFDLVVE